MTIVAMKPLDNVPIYCEGLPVRTGTISPHLVNKNINAISLIHFNSFLAHKAIISKL